MLRYQNCEIVFQEVPGEVSLAINISGCPHRCPDCHSKWLWNDDGDSLNIDSLDFLLLSCRGITCVSFMGGDSDVNELKDLLKHVKSKGLKTCWYSGMILCPIETDYLDYLKLGPYVKALGGLDNPNTNQRFYQVSREGNFVDKTFLFRKCRTHRI